MSLIKFFCPRENAKLELEERKKLLFNFFLLFFFLSLIFFGICITAGNIGFTYFLFLDSSSISVRSIISAAM